MTRAVFRSRSTITMAWVTAPLLLGTALYYSVFPAGRGLDSFALVAATSSGLVGLLELWTLAKRRVPVVTISNGTLELGSTFPFQRPRSVVIDEINGIALRRFSLVIETRAGTMKFLRAGLSEDDLQPIVAAIRRRIADRLRPAGGD